MSPQSPSPMEEETDLRMTAAVDVLGGPIVADLPQPSLYDHMMKAALMYVVVPLFAPPIMLVSLARGKLNMQDVRELYRLVSDATSDPINKQPEYQDEDLLSKVYKMPSAKQYIARGALEWQKREGFCAPATLRCILKSLNEYPVHLLPAQTQGPSTPAKWCTAIKELAEEEHIEMPCLQTEIVSGDVEYQAFLESLRKVNDEKCRVAINYLRPALFGFKAPRWHVSNLCLGMFAGHFSPILGVLEDKDRSNDPLVAVFDVNHTYGGTYLVRASRLYESVRAKDITTRKSRALVILSQ